MQKQAVRQKSPAPRSHFKQITNENFQIAMGALSAQNRLKRWLVMNAFKDVGFHDVYDPDQAVDLAIKLMGEALESRRSSADLVQLMALSNFEAMNAVRKANAQRFQCLGLDEEAKDTENARKAFAETFHHLLPSA